MKKQEEQPKQEVFYAVPELTMRKVMLLFDEMPFKFAQMIVPIKNELIGCETLHRTTQPESSPIVQEEINKTKTIKK